MVSEAQKRASLKWDKKNNKQYPLKLNRNYDKDIIEWLEAQENKLGYLKAIIRNDIKTR